MKFHVFSEASPPSHERALTDHLRLRIPGKGELTLSIPDGLIRALRENRLPARVEAWHAEREEWVSLTAHPAARRALETIGSYLPSPESSAADDLELVPPSEAAIETPDRVPEPEPAPEPDPVAEVKPVEPEPVESRAEPVAPITESSPPVEPEPEPPVELLDLRTAPPIASPEPPPRQSRLDIVPPPARHEERRSREMRPSSQRQPPPPPPEPEPPPPRRTFKIPGGRQLAMTAGVGALLLAVYFLKFKKAEPGTTTDSPPVAVTPADESRNAGTPPDSTATETALPDPGFVPADDPAPRIARLELQGVPGGGPEADLETRLRLADALMWNPSADFGSPGAVLRSRRKVDAVLNSIQAYRVDMRRLADSAGAARLGNRMEPFDEASRIDEVVHTMGEAIAVLEDVSGRFAVRGGTLEFDRTDDARRYNALRERADSLLRARVEMDPNPGVRPPRRLVTRLLQTLPGGMARGP